MEACCLSYAKLQWHANTGALPFKDPKLWMVKCSIGHEHEVVRRMGSLIEGAMTPMTTINMKEADSNIRDGCILLRMKG